MKRNLILIVLLIISNTINAQPDCIFNYAFKGKLSPSSDFKNSKILIAVPSPEFLIKSVDSVHGFNIIEIKGSKVDYENNFITIGNSHFCGSLKNIIDNIFKGKLEYYTVIIIKNGMRIEKKIYLPDIKFYSEKNKVIIELPEISI